MLEISDIIKCTLMKAEFKVLMYSLMHKVYKSNTGISVIYNIWNQLTYNQIASFLRERFFFLPMRWQKVYILEPFISCYLDGGEELRDDNGGALANLFIKDCPSITARYLDPPVTTCHMDQLVGIRGVWRSKHGILQRQKKITEKKWMKSLKKSGWNRMPDLMQSENHTDSSKSESYRFYSKSIASQDHLGRAYDQKSESYRFYSKNQSQAKKSFRPRINQSQVKKSFRPRIIRSKINGKPKSFRLRIIQILAKSIASQNHLGWESYIF